MLSRSTISSARYVPLDSIGRSRDHRSRASPFVTQREKSTYWLKSLHARWRVARLLSVLNPRSDSWVDYGNSCVTLRHLVRSAAIGSSDDVKSDSICNADMLVAVAPAAKSSADRTSVEYIRPPTVSDAPTS